MSLEPLSYAKPDKPQPKPPPTPEQRCQRRRALRVWLLSLLLLACLVYTLFLGDNRWRVRFQHFVSLPASARQIECGGCRIVPGGGQARARFRIDPADLKGFLSQYHEELPGWDEDPPYRPKPWSRPVGDFAGWTPAANDRVEIRWRTTDDGVLIDLETDTN